MTDSPAAKLPDTPETGAALGEVAATLWREREVLEDLLYALTVENLVLRSGDPKWLVRADAAVADAAHSLREHEVIRAMEVERLAARFGIDGSDVTLTDLADRSPEPWPTVLVDHRIALLELTEQIEELTGRNREMLLAGERATTEALARIRTHGVGAAGGAAAVAAEPVRYPGRVSVTTRSVFDEQA